MLSTQNKTWVAAGTGWGSYVERLLDSADEDGMVNKQFKPVEILVDCFPSAEVIVKLAVEEFEAGNTITAAHAIPVYLRNDVAKKPKAVIL